MAQALSTLGLGVVRCEALVACRPRLEVWPGRDRARRGEGGREEGGRESIESEQVRDWSDSFRKPRNQVKMGIQNQIRRRVVAVTIGGGKTR